MVKIRWAPPLPLHKLVRLYESDAAGCVDGELLNDVAWSLYARCVDVVLVSRGLVRCPECVTEIRVAMPGTSNRPSTCPTCAWSVTWDEYHRSWEHRDLWGSNAIEAFLKYVAALPEARTDAARMRVVDELVHAAHKPARRQTIGNIAARNLFEGRRARILATLDSLAYGGNSAADPRLHARWRQDFVQRRFPRR